MKHPVSCIDSDALAYMRRTQFIPACVLFVACVFGLAARAQKDAEVARLGRVMAWKAGQVIAEGPPSAVRNDPRVVASYLGTDERAIVRSGRTRTPAPT